MKNLFACLLTILIAGAAFANEADPQSFQATYNAGQECGPLTKTPRVTELPTLLSPLPCRLNLAQPDLMERIQEQIAAKGLKLPIGFIHKPTLWFVMHTTGTARDNPALAQLELSLEIACSSNSVECKVRYLQPNTGMVDNAINIWEPEPAPVPQSKPELPPVSRKAGKK